MLYVLNVQKCHLRKLDEPLLPVQFSYTWRGWCYCILSDDNPEVQSVVSSKYLNFAVFSEFFPQMVGYCAVICRSIKLHSTVLSPT